MPVEELVPAWVSYDQDQTTKRLAPETYGMSGGRDPMVTDEEILQVFLDADPPVLGTSEVAAELPIKRRGTDDRLRELADDGRLETRTVGQTRVWWHPDRVD